MKKDWLHLTLMLLYLSLLAGTVATYPITSEIIVNIFGYEDYLCWFLRDFVMEIGMLWAASISFIEDKRQRLTAASIAVTFAIVGLITLFLFYYEYNTTTYLINISLVASLALVTYKLRRHEH